MGSGLVGVGRRGLWRRMMTWAVIAAWSVVVASGTAVAQDVQQVIHISVDGLQGKELETLMLETPERFPTFHRFVREGAYTFNARNDFFSSWTLPNHATMMTGRPVLQPEDDPTVHHGYTQNVDPRPTTTLNNAGNPLAGYIASTFDRAHDHGLTTALYSGKSKFSLFNQTWSITAESNGGRPDTYLANGDQGRSKIDRYLYESGNGTSQKLVARMLEEFKTTPYNYAFLHLADPDSVGHDMGWRTPEWIDSVALVDNVLGQVLDFVGSDSRFRGQTAIVLTADHGGSLLNHGDTTEFANVNIPLMVWGPMVPPGYDLYTLNEMTRRDPQSTIPNYRAPLQPIRHGDSANLAMSLLGLPAVEGSYINARQDLRVELPVSLVWDGTDAQAGVAGDGSSWNDPRNWTRRGVVDRMPIAGDILTLPQNSGVTTIQVPSTLPLDSIQAAGAYELRAGDQPIAMRMSTGTIDVAEGGRLTIHGSIATTRDILKGGAGTLELNGSVPMMLIRAGIVSGNLRVDGDLTNRGTLAPGDGINTVVVAGNYLEVGRGQMLIELGPANAPSDKLEVAGAASLWGSGILDVDSTARSRDSVVAGTFLRDEILTTQRLVNKYRQLRWDGRLLKWLEPAVAGVDVAEVDADNQPGRMVRLEHQLKKVSLVDYQALPGDVDGDGAFLAGDLVRIFAEGRYENSLVGDARWTSGDWNGDREFNTSDLVVAFAAGRYEQPSIFTPVAAVPEASSVTLLGAGLITLAGWRRLGGPPCKHPVLRG